MSFVTGFEHKTRTNPRSDNVRGFRVRSEVEQFAFKLQDAIKKFIIAYPSEATLLDEEDLAELTDSQLSNLPSPLHYKNPLLMLLGFLLKKGYMEISTKKKNGRKWLDLNGTEIRFPSIEVWDVLKYANMWNAYWKENEK